MKRPKPKLNQDALAFFANAGRRGAKKRKKTVSPERRREIAKKAAKARWAAKAKTT